MALGEFGFPSLQQQTVVTKSEDSKITIPCPTTDPRASIGLYKFDPQVINGKIYHLS